MFPLMFTLQSGPIQSLVHEHRPDFLHEPCKQEAKPHLVVPFVPYTLISAIDSCAEPFTLTTTEVARSSGYSFSAFQVTTLAGSSNVFLATTFSPTLNASSRGADFEGW